MTAAWIGPLAWEPPYAVDVTLKRPKKKKVTVIEQRDSVEFLSHAWTWEVSPGLRSPLPDLGSQGPRPPTQRFFGAKTVSTLWAHLCFSLTIFEEVHLSVHL